MEEANLIISLMQKDNYKTCLAQLGKICFGLLVTRYSLVKIVCKKSGFGEAFKKDLN